MMGTHASQNPSGFGGMQSPTELANGKLGDAAGGGFASVTSGDKGYANMGSGAGQNGFGPLQGAGHGRLGLDSNNNALTVSKRLPKEETV